MPRPRDESGTFPHPPHGLAASEHAPTLHARLRFWRLKGDLAAGSGDAAGARVAEGLCGSYAEALAELGRDDGRAIA